MRFKRDKADGPAGAPPPDGSTRVEDAVQPPSAAERAETPTAVQPTRESKQPAKVLPPTDGDGDGKGPQSPGATPPDPGARVHAAPPKPAHRVATPAAAAAAPAAAAIAAPPPQPGQLVSAAPPAGQVACPHCGSRAEPGQEMCIVCGSRIAPPYGKERGWGLPAVLAGLGVLLIGTAIAFGISELTKDDEVKKDDVADLSPDTQPAPPPASTQPTPPATPPADQTPTIPPATQGNPPENPNAEPGAPAPSTPAPDTGGEIAEWPAGKTAYTVVLVSATSRNAADAKAEQAIKRGIEAGVLRSDDFSTLRPGYWVVFAGQYDTSEQATRAADRYASQGFGGGYPRQVKPK